MSWQPASPKTVTSCSPIYVHSCCLKQLLFEASYMPSDCGPCPPGSLGLILHSTCWWLWPHRYRFLAFLTHPCPTLATLHICRCVQAAAATRHLLPAWSPLPRVWWARLLAWCTAPHTSQVGTGGYGVFGAILPLEHIAAMFLPCHHGLQMCIVGANWVVAPLCPVVIPIVCTHVSVCTRTWACHMHCTGCANPQPRSCSFMSYMMHL
jgi:hypothetical protein